MNSNKTVIKHKFDEDSFVKNYVSMLEGIRKKKEKREIEREHRHDNLTFTPRLQTSYSRN
jgi:hypothetical protein